MKITIGTIAITACLFATSTLQAQAVREGGEISVCSFESVLCSTTYIR